MLTAGSTRDGLAMGQILLRKFTIKCKREIVIKLDRYWNRPDMRATLHSDLKARSRTGSCGAGAGNSAWASTRFLLLGRCHLARLGFLAIFRGTHAVDLNRLR